MFGSDAATTRSRVGPPGAPPWPDDWVVAPLTFGQKSLWRSEEAIPAQNRPEWHFARVWPVPAGVSVEQVEAALEALIRTHEALRTFLRTSPTLGQVVAPPFSVRLEQTHVEEATFDEALHQAKRIAADPFDLESEVGWRAGVLLSHDVPAYVYLAFDHFVSDLWGLQVLEADWTDVLTTSSDPNDAPQAREMALEQQSAAWAKRLTQAEAYWRKVLADHPAEAGDGQMAFSREAERIQGTLESDCLGPRVAKIAAASGVTVQAAMLALVLEGLRDQDFQFRQPFILMASNRFDARWSRLVSTLNQAALFAVPPAQDGDGLEAFAEQANAVEWATRVAYRHGCYDIDEFTRVATDVRGAPVGYDYFFNYGATGTFTALDVADNEPRLEVTPSPQSNGPSLEVRVNGDDVMRLDVRVDAHEISAEQLSALLLGTHERVVRLAGAAS